MSVHTAAAGLPWGGTAWPGHARVGRLVRRRPELVTAVLAALVLALDQRGPDLPAQDYRAWLWRTHGMVIFDSHWYAGHPLPGYSLLYPPLAALVGSRLLGALACIAATAALARLLRGPRDSGHDLALLWFAAVSVVDLVVGRVPFAVGLAFGVAALATARERRRWWTLALALAAGAASPLAGAFLLLAVAAWLPEAGWRRVWPLGGPLVGVAAAVAFGEGGWFPFPAVTFVTVVAFALVGLALAPRRAPSLRRGLWLYLLSSVAFFVIPNPIGGNMVRLAAVFAGPVAAYYLLAAGRRRALAIVAAPLLVWQFAPVPGAVASGHGNPSATEHYYAGLVGYLKQHGAPGSRVEVPLTAGRWETDYLAKQVALARGWERQVDIARNAVLYRTSLNAADYDDWLVANDVRWVALPDVPLDSSEAPEKALLVGPPLPFLQLVWSDPHWRLWRVLGSPPLVTGPAQLQSFDVNAFRLVANGVGFAVVRVHWTRFWQVVEGHACLAPAPNGWTSVQLFGAGPVTVAARVGFGTLAGVGGDGSCADAQPGS